MSPFLKLFSILFLSVSLIAVGVFWLLYTTAFDQISFQLQSTVNNQKSLINSVTDFGNEHRSNYPEGIKRATLSQIENAHKDFKNFGETGEFVIAERSKDNIVFVFRQRHSNLNVPDPIPFSSDLAEPMRQALSGKEGIILTKDYRGEMVLAAYTFVEKLNIGLVAKIDLNEIRKPFINAAFKTFIFSILVLTLVARVMLKLWTPIRQEKIESEKKLRDSETHLKTIFNSINIGTIALNEDGEILMFNPAAEKIFGYKREEVVGKKPSFLFEGVDFDPSQETDEKSTPFTGLEIGGSKATGLHKSGEKFPIQCDISKFDITGGIGCVCSFRDLTEINSLETQLRHLQKIEAIGNLTGGLAHDFNNLLAIILGNLSVLEMDLDAGHDISIEGLRKIIDSAKKASDRGVSLTNRLLSFSRQQTLNPKPLYVDKVVDGMANLLGRTLGANIGIIWDLKASNWLVNIDAGQLESALLNLSINARDAMPQNGKLTISTEEITLTEKFVKLHIESKEGEYVLLSVCDTGVGIDANTIEKVFDPFFTTKELGESSGLGLSMIFGFIKQSDGIIEIESDVGVGTCVKIYFPRSQTKDLTEPQNMDKFHDLKGDETILVVEDDDDVRNIAVQMLEYFGYTVYNAVDGKSALDFIKKNKTIDLLLTDIVLPGGLNGTEIAKKFKKQRPDIKILFMSGYTDGALSEYKEFNTEINLMQKPFSIEELASMVRNILDA